MNKMTLEQAIAKIEKLEKENEKLKKSNEELKADLEYYKARKASGRQPHNQKWTGIYNDFVDMYESGTSISEIAKSKNLSARTIYRYKAYYEKMKEATKE